MAAYLLDTNHVDPLFRQEPRAFVEELRKHPPETFFWISSVSLGEIEAAYLTNDRDPDVVKPFRRFMQTEFTEDERTHKCQEVSRFTGQYYAQVIEALRLKHPKRRKDQKDERYLLSLGLDVNDVWIVATALEHNFTLLTTDKGIDETIKEALGDRLRTENWLA